MNNLPVAFTAARLLRRGWVLAGIARFGEVTWEVLLRSGGAIGKAGVVTVVALVGAGHC